LVFIAMESASTVQARFGWAAKEGRSISHPLLASPYPRVSDGFVIAVSEIL